MSPYLQMLRDRITGFANRLLSKIRRFRGATFPPYPGTRIRRAVLDYLDLERGGNDTILDSVIGGAQYQHLRGLIPVNGTSASFASSLVRCLYQYDRLTRQSTVVELLNFLKQTAGVERSAQLDELIEEYEAYRNATLTAVAPDPSLGLRPYVPHALLLIILAWMVYQAARPVPLELVGVWPPKYGQGVGRDPTVFLNFNKPVSPDANLAFEPPDDIIVEKLATGSASSRTIGFVVKGLRHGTKYRVRLVGVKGERGDTLDASECQWEYTVAAGDDRPPELSRWDRGPTSSDEPFPLRPRIEFHFDEPVVSGEYELAEVRDGKPLSPLAKGRMSLEPNEKSDTYVFIDFANYEEELDPGTQYELKVMHVVDEHGNTLEKAGDPIRFKTAALAAGDGTPATFQDLIGVRKQPESMSKYKWKVVRWTGVVLDTTYNKNTMSFILLGDNCEECLKWDLPNPNSEHAAIFYWRDNATFPTGLKKGANVCLEGTLMPVSNLPASSFEVKDADWFACQ